MQREHRGGKQQKDLVDRGKIFDRGGRGRRHVVPGSVEIIHRFANPMLRLSHRIGFALN